jgi:hypothetical protein
MSQRSFHRLQYLQGRWLNNEIAVVPGKANRLCLRRGLNIGIWILWLFKVKFQNMANTQVNVA